MKIYFYLFNYKPFKYFKLKYFPIVRLRDSQDSADGYTKSKPK